jgi:hypothetical protein
MLKRITTALATVGLAITVSATPSASTRPGQPPSKENGRRRSH